MKKIVVSLVLCLVLLFVLAAPVLAAPVSQEVAPAVELTPQLLGGIAGIVLSLAFSYIPWLNVKFAELAPDLKRLILLGVLLATTLTIYALNCEGIIDTGLACDRTGIIQLITIFISTLIANQSAFSLTPLPAPVKLAADEAKEKALRDAYIGVP